MKSDNFIFEHRFIPCFEILKIDSTANLTRWNVEYRPKTNNIPVNKLNFHPKLVIIYKK